VTIVPVQNIMPTKGNITEHLLTLTKGLNSTVLTIIIVIIILVDKPGAMM
jgi:hypothetical protein